METPEYQLIIAAYEGDIERVGALLDQGVAVDFRDGESRTPLIWASGRGHRAVVALLLDREANVNAEAIGQWTPLLSATWFNQFNTLQLLVSRGANIHHIDKYGYSSLLQAALGDRLPICEYLLSLGADLMVINNRKQTALADYGHGAWPPLSPETKALRRAALKRAWENGLHPSQVQRRRDELWERRGPLLTVLAEHAYRPLQARALEIELAALSLDPNEPVLISTKPKEVILHDEGMVRYIVGFL